MVSNLIQSHQQEFGLQNVTTNLMETTFPKQAFSCCIQSINIQAVHCNFLKEGERACLCVCVFSAGMTLGSLLSLDTSLLISFNQPIMYCQPHSGILIGTLSQATLLPPPMSPHVENPHSMSWRNRECQVTIFFLFYPCCEDSLGARASFFFFLCSTPSLPHPHSHPYFIYFLGGGFLALLSYRAWPPEAGAEQPLPGSEFRAGPGAVRLTTGPRFAPEG